MKPIHKLFLASVFLPMATHAATVTWGTPTAITGANDIVTSSLTVVSGANFGIETGTTTLVNNGSVDVEFKSLRSGQSATLANGLTVNAASTWRNFGPGPNTDITGDFGDVLGSNLGIEGEAGPMSADITLSGLTIGTQYQIQFFTDSTGTNDQTISGSASMNTLSGQFVTGTFIADATTQVLTVTRSTDFGVANALTIGAFAPADTTPPNWTATWPQVSPLSSTSLTVRAKTNETGKAYYVVLPDDAPAPSASQVKAGTDSSNVAASAAGTLTLTANTEASAPVAGLTTSTNYDVYFVAEDAAPNLQASPTLVNASTDPEPATITWGTPQTVVNNTDIQSAGVTNLAGVKFGATSTETTTVNNGFVDVDFAGKTSNAQVTLSNGLTVASSGYTDFVNTSAPAGVTGAYRTVMTRQAYVNKSTAIITLGNLTPGTEYQIQTYITGSDPTLNYFSGSPALATGGGNAPASTNGFGQWIVGTFTANAVKQTLTHTANNNEPVINALTIGVVSTGNTFANWIGGYSGLNGLTGFNDDADFDGLDNGLENFLGTAPNAGNAGLTAGSLSGNTFTFTHPQNATPASEVSAPVYTWSTDLVNWNATGASSGGITVNLLATPNTPSAGTTTVSATVIGTAPSKLFVRLGVSQN